MNIIWFSAPHDYICDCKYNLYEKTDYNS
jgi:hypothetical protein